MEIIEKGYIVKSEYMKRAIQGNGNEGTAVEIDRYKAKILVVQRKFCRYKVQNSFQSTKYKNF